jgi:hypothetical protein
MANPFLEIKRKRSEEENPFLKINKPTEDNPFKQIQKQFGGRELPYSTVAKSDQVDYPEERNLFGKAQDYVSGNVNTVLNQARAITKTLGKLDIGQKLQEKGDIVKANQLKQLNPQVLQKEYGTTDIGEIIGKEKEQKERVSTALTGLLTGATMELFKDEQAEKLQKKYPMTWGIAKGGGDVINTLGLVKFFGPFTKGVGPKVSRAIPMLQETFPTAARVLGSMASRGLIGGGIEATKEFARQFTKAEDITDINFGRIAKEGGWGIPTWAPWGIIPATKIGGKIDDALGNIKRGGLAGLLVGSSTLSIAKARKPGKPLTSEDYVNAAINAITAALTQGYNAKEIAQAYESQEIKDWNLRAAKAKIKSNFPGISDAEASKRAIASIGKWGLSPKARINYIKTIDRNTKGLQKQVQELDEALRKTVKTPPKATPPKTATPGVDLKSVIKPPSLIQEAKKVIAEGKTVEEFVKAQFEKPSYGMAHRPTYEDMPPAHNLLEGEAIPRDVYEHPEWSIASGRNVKTDKSARESWGVLQKIRNKPEAEVTVYRATRQNQLNPGDWVTFSKTYAQESVEPNTPEKVYSFKVKAKDVIFAGDDINEFGYYPKSQLTDIWKQAQGEKGERIEDLPTEMHLGVPLYPEKFVQEDIIPAATKVISTGKGMSKSIRSFFAPESSSKQAYRAGMTIRQSLARKVQQTEKFAEDSEKRLLFWEKVPEEEKLSFIMGMEKGEISSKFEPLAKEYRKILDEAYELSKDLSEKINYIDNYFPHIWAREDVPKVKDFLYKYKTRIGKEKYSKLRGLDLVKTGLELGFKLKTTNPESLVTARYVSALRAKAHADMLKRMQEQGVLKEVSPQEKDPNKALIQTPFGIFEGQPEIINLINRKLQPSIYELDNWFGDVMKGALQAKNMYVSYILNLSGFHAVEVTASDIAIQGVLAMKSLGRGHIGKAIEQASTAIVQPLVSILKGKQIQNAYYGKDAPEWAKRASEYLIRGGGRMTMPAIYKVKAKQAFMKAIHKKNVIGVIPRAVKLGLEYSMKPILEFYVPKLKVANYYKLVSDWLANHPNATTDQVDKYLSRTWDLMDYNFGQMVYDNLFWDRWARDLGVLSTLSLGWNMGTIRQFGGTPVDIVSNLKSIKSKSKDPLYVDRNLMTLAYLITIAGVGSLVGYLVAGRAPKTAKDFIAPPTGEIDDEGNEVRVVIPAMTKEFLSSTEAIRKYGIIRGIPKYASHKLSPALSEAIDVFIRNKDYYGVDIRDPQAPVLEQVGQVMDYFLKKKPISISSLQTNLRYNPDSSSWEKVAPFLGFSTAPKYVTRTKLQKEIFDINESKFKRDLTRAEWEKIKKKFELRKKIKENNLTNKDLVTAFKQGIIKGDTIGRLKYNLKTFAENAKLPKDVRVFKYLSNDEQLYLYQKMNSSEKKRYVPYMNKSLIEKLLRDMIRKENK